MVEGVRNSEVEMRNAENKKRRWAQGIKIQVSGVRIDNVTRNIRRGGDIKAPKCRAREVLTRTNYVLDFSFCIASS